MNQKISQDFCVQTDLDFADIETVESFSKKINCINKFSRSVNLRNQNLKIDVKSNFNSLLLRKIKTFDSNLKQQKVKGSIDYSKSFYHENESKVLRQKQFIPKSFHIETLNNFSTTQQIILPLKQSFTPFHIQKRKLNYTVNPYRLKTCPSDSNFCDRILYTNTIPQKIKHFDGIKAFK